MATEKTKAQTAKLDSTKAKAFRVPRAKPDTLKRLQATPSGQRLAVAMYASSDGRAKYAFDGISIRRIQ